jgi:MFS family permease
VTSSAAPSRPPAEGRAGALERAFPALAVGPYRLLLSGNLCAMLAYQASVVATGYAAFQMTGAATMLGLISLALGLPLLLFALIGGVVADRLPRHRVLLAAQGTLGTTAAALAGLALTGLLRPWHLIAIGLVQGTAFAFNMPARQALVADLVGPERLRSAIALNTSGINCCRIAGPALAGALLAIPAIGFSGVFVAMAGLYVVALVLLVRIDVPPRRPRTVATSGVADVLEGLRYIRSSPVLLALLGLAFVPLLFGMPYQTLMPVFAERVFGVGAQGLGVLMAAAGVGSLIGSIAVAALAAFPRPAVLQLGVGVLFGASLLAFALAPSFVVAVATLVVVGFTSAAYTAINNTLVLANAEPRLHGRVMSVYLITFAVSPVAALPMSWLTDWLGAPATVAGGGLIVAAVVAGFAALYPPYRNIR